MKKTEKSQEKLNLTFFEKVKITPKAIQNIILIIILAITLMMIRGIIFSRQNDFIFLHKNIERCSGFIQDKFLSNKNLAEPEEDCEGDVTKDPSNNMPVTANNMLWGGKPVIYLYPKETINVLVKIKPTGGSMISVPEYGEGWYVQAKPDGELYNFADGKKYPYLFWEGLLYNFDIDNQGALIRRDDIRAFLEASLQKQGLIKNEYDEFVEFWLPRMQEEKYYQVYFLSKAEIDYLAPLKVSPDPETVIRVFMIYKSWNHNTETKAQDWVTPIRKGFTVVEWGGALQ